MSDLAHLKLDGLEVQRVSGGRLWLDGGTMFGVVPKSLWARKAPADDANRVEFDTNCLLVRTQEAKSRTILIETGYGSNPSPRQKQHQKLDDGHPLLNNLAKLGVRPEDIDLVILTHLHFDHAGGCTVLDGERHRPAFPRARYVAQEAEWRDAMANLPELSGNYPPENLLGLGEAGVMQLINGNIEIVPGITAHMTGGHTRGHQALILGAGARRAIYLGDLCPTSHHLKTFWSMSYDQFLLETRRVKPRVLGEAADKGWPVIFDHDVKVHAAMLARDAREEFVVREAMVI